jgi:hypothetical protein
MKMYRGILLAGLLSAIGSGHASADGMPSLKDTVAAPKVPTWSGMYFGGSVGYGWNDSTNNYSDSTGGRSSRDEDADGGLVSLIWGIDCMFRDRFVVGGFVDVDWSNIERGSAGDGMTIDRSFAIGGRIGMLVRPETLAFLTGGYTRARFDNDGWWNIVDATDPASGILPGRNKVDFDGFFIGAGLEHRISNNFFLRGEVRWAKYDSEITNSGVAFDGTTYVDKEDPELVTARLGLIYKLGRDEGVFSRTPPSEDSLKVISYGGIDVAKDIWTTYSGNLVALNGNFNTNGIVARTFGWYADIDGNDGDATDRAMDAMLGYMHYFGTWVGVGYVGMEVRDVDVKTNSTGQRFKETETGFKVALEIESGEQDPLYFSFDTSYSTAFDTYFGQLRVGYNRNGTKFGPEGEIWSEDGDVTSRLGAFVSFPITLLPSTFTEVSLSGGYQWVEDDDAAAGASNALSGIRGGEGAYFNSMIKLVF